MAHRQLTALGISADSVAYRIRSGRLHALHRGVYAVGHPNVSGRGVWMAAVIACGSGALLSHRSAAALLGLRQDARAWVDVTVPVSGRRGRPGLVVHSAPDLTPRDRAVRHGIPVTALPRTLLDCATVLSPRQLERAFEAAERNRVLDMRALHELAARSRGHHGLGQFRRLIGRHLVVPETHTELERRFAGFCDDHDLPRPAFNVAVEGFMVDGLWPLSRLVAELDSFEFHRTRAMFESDRARDTALQLAGYRIIRVTSRRMDEDAAGLASAIRGLLDRAAA